MTTLFIDNEPLFLEGPPGAFVPLAEVRALKAQIAALTAERDGLREALKNMLYIFDQGYDKADSLGQMRCDEARRALDNPT